MKYIRTEDEIIDLNNTNKCIFVIRDNSTKESDDFRYVSYLWDNWRNYFLIDYQNCMLFSYNSAQNFISDLIKENLEYQNLVIELSPYYKNCEQADTIKELCDVYVIVGEDKDTNGNPILWSIRQDIPFFMKYYFNYNDIYAAIWTDKGLIYVAKMNSEGKLVLI